MKVHHTLKPLRSNFPGLCQTSDPSGDVRGWDAAGKVSILAKIIIFGKDIPVSEVERQGITCVTPEKIKEAFDSGYAVKLIAGLNWVNRMLYAYVTPKEIPFSASSLLPSREQRTRFRSLATTWEEVTSSGRVREGVRPDRRFSSST